MASMSLFTPMSGLLGGALIGASAGILLHTNGAIMGYSGLIRSYLHPTSADTSPQWKMAFLGSFLTTVQLVRFLLQPTAAEPSPATNVPTTIAMLLGGLLVGLGTSLSNGCTSGHGICGLGRISPRSFAAVLTFLSAGVVTSVAIASLPVLEQSFRTSGIPDSSTMFGLAVTAVTLGLAGIAKPRTKEMYGAVLSGSLGAMGLALSGMVNTSKVIGFLDISRLRNDGSGSNGGYDPTLLCVMGGGVVVSAISYRLLDRSKPPVYATKWSIPSSTTIDTRLLGGAALFGIGWAMTGVCPGPALWQLGAGSVPVAMHYFPAFLTGSYLGEMV